MWHFQEERRQTLEKLTDAKCRYTTCQVMTGVLSPLAHLLPGNDLRKSFDELTQALKAYAEKQRYHRSIISL